MKLIRGVGLSRCNYFENGPVLDSNQLTCKPSVLPNYTGLKLSNLGISYNPFSSSFLFLKASFL